MVQDIFKDIKTIFIDLDDTIWDFTANSKVAMRSVYEAYGLSEQCPYDKFIEVYLHHNEELWSLYHHGKISQGFLKSERFRVSFADCGIEFSNPELPTQFDYEYLETIVKQTQVVEGAYDLLSHLTKRGEVHVLSNGFKNLQHRKLKSGGLDGYISKLILSDDIGITKPDRRLFDYALTQVGGEAGTTLMIGDNYDADILGAINAGWHTVFFNRKGIVPEPDRADLTVGKLTEIIPYL